MSESPNVAKTTQKCQGKDRHMNPCRYNALIQIGSTFCKNHQYMNDYTEVQLQNLSTCSTCHKSYFLENRKVCKNCATREKETRCKNKLNVVKCALKKCNSKKSDLNKYCLLHQIHVWIDEVHESNHKPCAQYIRGCRNVLTLDSKYKKCDSCRKTEREKDKLLRDKKKEKNIELTNETVKGCNSCGKIQNRHCFVGEKNQETLTCHTCRERDKIQNTKRDKEHRRAQNRVYDSKPETKMKKQMWANANWDKVVRRWRAYRAREREKGEKEYLEKNASYAKQWRSNNPQAVQAQHERKKENLHCQYKVYIQSAKHRNIEYQLSFKDYERIVKNACYYCGVVNQKRGFHGMDRKDNCLAYTNENTVACCAMCNYMKGTLSDETFLQRVWHILTHNKKIEEKYVFPESFKNYGGSCYLDYKRRAEKKQLCFELSKENFTKLTYSTCYLCGKEKTFEHCNGIDRINNSQGYSIENSKTCCGGCNYMKNAFAIDTFFTQLLSIYKHQHSIS